MFLCSGRTAMIIKSLKLENFRNFSRSELQFESDAVFFEGGNGQGKTSLLEALYYVANLRSFRTVKINELKKLGCQSFHLSLLFRIIPSMTIVFFIYVSPSFLPSPEAEGDFPLSSALLLFLPKSRRRSAFPTTKSELALIAAAAIIGSSLNANDG